MAWGCGFGVALGSQSVAYQLALGWLWGGFGWLFQGLRTILWAAVARVLPVKHHFSRFTFHYWPPPCDFRFLLSQFQLFTSPARALAAETLKLERTLSDLVNQAYGLTSRCPQADGNSAELIRRHHGSRLGFFWNYPGIFHWMV
jgi:hypothetical protein